MRKLVVVLSIILLLSACVNTGKIVSGKLVVNNTEKDLSGKEIVLNDDCSPKSVTMNIPYCGNGNMQKGDVCTTTPDKQQYGYKIFQVVGAKDALVCTMNGYGSCYGNVEYIKNLAADYESLVDDVGIKDNFLLKTDPYSYHGVLGNQKTVNSYELITSVQFKKIKYRVENAKQCPKLEYSYSRDKGAEWIED
jgi:hypothetical protein